MPGGAQQRPQRCVFLRQESRTLPLRIRLCNIDICMARLYLSRDFVCSLACTQHCNPDAAVGRSQVMHIGANLGEVIVGARFGPHLGEYMLHCHNGVHEDNDMMRAFMVSGRAALCSAACGGKMADDRCTVISYSVPRHMRARPRCWL